MHVSRFRIAGLMVVLLVGSATSVFSFSLKSFVESFPIVGPVVVDVVEVTLEATEEVVKGAHHIVNELVEEVCDSCEEVPVVIGVYIEDGGSVTPTVSTSPIVPTTDAEQSDQRDNSVFDFIECAYWMIRSDNPQSHDNDWICRSQQEVKSEPPST